MAKKEVKEKSMEETLWESANKLRGTNTTFVTITEHIQIVFKEGELDEKVVFRNFRLTTQNGAIKGKTQDISVKN